MVENQLLGREQGSKEVLLVDFPIRKLVLPGIFFF